MCFLLILGREVVSEDPWHDPSNMIRSVTTKVPRMFDTIIFIVHTTISYYRNNMPKRERVGFWKRSGVCCFELLEGKTCNKIVRVHVLVSKSQ